MSPIGTTKTAALGGTGRDARDLSSKDILHDLFQAALDASYPDGKFEGRLPQRPKGRTIVLGGGKGAARMAAAFETAWGGGCEGIVITRYGHGTATRSIKVVEAAHPIPDATGLRATEQLLEIARSATADDLVVVVISGGASSLMTMPHHGVSLEQKQDINRQLLRSGASISAINIVRKSLSAIKGGRLALAAAPARVVTYVISDVPGDNPAIVGSGPSIIEARVPGEALAIIDRFNIDLPGALRQLIAQSDIPTVTAESEVHILASPRLALEAAARRAESLGLKAVILGDAIEGEAREVATVMAGIAQSARRFGDPVSPPCVLLSGGETTVTVRGDGRGGRNAEFLLALAVALGETPSAAMACDTDGIDGSEDNAGAWFDESLARAGVRSQQQEYLHRNDAYSYFESLNQLTFTGPTLTNVNDFRAILLR